MIVVVMRSPVVVMHDLFLSEVLKNRAARSAVSVAVFDKVTDGIRHRLKFDNFHFEGF